MPSSGGDTVEVVIDSMPKVNIPPLRELMGRVSPTQDSAFAPIPSELCSRDGMHLRREARDAFVRMHDAAAAEGISLTALSATRTFGHQASIWNRKWNGAQRMGMAPVDRALDILRFSSMPGSSRHHWGTDVDMHSLEPADFEQGEGARTLAWLRAHARGLWVRGGVHPRSRPAWVPARGVALELRAAVCAVFEGPERGLDGGEARGV